MQKCFWGRLRNFCVLFFLASGVLGSALVSRGAASPELPSVDFIMGRVWANMEMAPFRLEGIIRTPTAKHPITLLTGQREMTYLMGGAEPDVRVQFSSDGARVQSRADEKSPWREMPRSVWDRPLLASDITPRDLALDFLAWPGARVIGRGNAKTLPAFILEADSPEKDSTIRSVRYWISTEHFVLVQAEAYDANGRVVKRFDVNGVQRFGEFWTIKELRVANMVPGRNISRSRTFIEIARGTPMLD